jgi:PAS domain-containing protein
MSYKKQKRSKRRNPAETVEALNRAILDSALDCIITMDASGRVREFNPAAERVFGFVARKRSAKNWPNSLSLRRCASNIEKDWPVI